MQRLGQMKYRLIDEKQDEYIKAYNAIVEKYETTEWQKDVGLSFHHILPRAYFPEFKDDSKNWLYVPVMEHIRLHYLLWKHDWKYCAAFWFCYVYFHKIAATTSLTKNSYNSNLMCENIVVIVKETNYDNRKRTCRTRTQ